MRKGLNAAFLGIAVFAAIFGMRSLRPSFDRVPWQDDYRQLFGEVINRYPNLSWSMAAGRLDLRQLDRATRDALRRASSNEEGERAIRTFVRAFRDRHFSVQKAGHDMQRKYQEPRDGQPDRATSPEKLCRLLKFADEDPDFELPFQMLRSFRRLPTSPANPFPAGVLTLEGRRIAILRIPSFDERYYLSACLADWRVRRGNLLRPCDGQCLGSFMMQLRNHLLADLAARVRQLEAEKPDILLLDITHNGGGFDWYEPAGAIFAVGGDNGLRVSMLRDRASLADLRRTGKWILQDLRSPDLTERERRLLTDSAASIRALIHEARQPCEWAAFKLRGPDCSFIVAGDYFASGLYHSRPPALRDSWLSADELFQASGYVYDEGVPTVPLAILMDRQTGSAAEHFAEGLRSASGALSIGDHTAGAGGGWIHGKAPLVLEHSRLEVSIPDHITWFPDGSNFVVGLDPDVCVGWLPGDEPIARLRKVVDALRRL